jgi:hypothetical protein
MKNILFVHYGNDWIRGSEVVLLDMLTARVAQGENPILWCNSRCLADAAEKIGAKVIVDRFVCLGYWILPRWDVVQYVKLLNKTWHILKSSDIDIVHCNNGAPCQWLSVICRLVKVPLVLHLHARYQQRDRLTLLFYFADRVIGVSQSVVDIFQAKECQPEKLALVHNGISSERVVSTHPLDIRQMLDAQTNQSVVLYVGSIIPRKGLNMLVSSIANVTKKHAVKLAIFGSGEGQTDLVKFVKKLGLENTIYFFPSKVDVAELYSSNADYFISTPKEEVFGLTLGEASLAGLPIISTCVAGIDEIYTDNENALLVPYGDVQKLSLALMQLIEQPALAQRLAHNAKQHITANFSLDKQNMAMEKQYDLVQNTTPENYCKVLRQFSLLVTKLFLLKIIKTMRTLFMRYCL